MMRISALLIPAALLAACDGGTPAEAPLPHHLHRVTGDHLVLGGLDPVGPGHGFRREVVWPAVGHRFGPGRRRVLRPGGLDPVHLHAGTTVLCR